MNIKEWAKKMDKKMRRDIDYFISQGIDKTEAVRMVFKGSTIGEGYKAQIRHDYEISIFEKL